MFTIPIIITVRVRIQNIQHLAAEAADQTLGDFPAYALHRAGLQKTADAVQGRGQHMLAGFGLELPAELRMFGPFAGKTQGFSGSHGTQYADDRG